MDVKPNLKADVDSSASDATIQKDPTAESMKDFAVLAPEDPPAALSADATVSQTRDGSGTFSRTLLENAEDKMLERFNIEGRGDENSNTHERWCEVVAESEADGTIRFSPPGACGRCKGLKVRCIFPPNETICKRCERGGHLCTVKGWALPPATPSLSSPLPRPVIQQLPGACTSCKELQIRCDFLENESVCSHCKASDHVCVSDTRSGILYCANPDSDGGTGQRPSYLYGLTSNPASQGRHVYQVKGNERPRPKPL